MRNSTLLFSLLLCATGANAQVAKPAGQAKFPAVFKALKAKRAAEAETAKLWRPKAEEHFIFMEEEWLPEGATTFTYDLAGNILTETVDFDGELERTTYTYNENNKKTSEIVEYFDEEEEAWVNETKTTYTYDNILPDFMTSRYEYTWDEVDEVWAVNTGKQSQTRTVTRDAKGNIISVELKAYYSFTDSWDIVQRTDITYDEATGKAVAFDFRIPEWGPDETIVYGDPVRYKNIEWENTDGQIVAEDLTECVFGANRFKSADCYEVEDDVETLSSHIEVKYVDGKEDFELTETSADGTEKSIGKCTITDTNGSIFMTNSYYMEDELTDVEYSALEYDDHGNITLEEDGVLVSEDEREIWGGARYTNTYDEEKDVLTEVQIEEYLFDEPEEGSDEEVTTGSYQLSEKYVYSDYYDVITAIGRMEGEANGEATVYDLQGVAVGRNAKNLPAGLYIMKHAGRVQKVLRK